MEEKRLYQHAIAPRVTVIIIAVIMIGLSLFLFRFAFLILFRFGSGGNLSFNALLYSLILIAGALILPSIWMNWWQSFEIDENGITFSVFLLWKKFVPWKSVIGIKKRRQFIATKYNKMYVVFAEQITPAHLILGLLYGGKLKPGFVIQIGPQEFEEAIKEISARTAIL
ncbi:MAG: hypothetical protein DWQ07_08460 [Chloroflexi bacterium]|nr:MAG: hypothetical protein DWQ07_08460 [Chloroflexota bacterium]MBL1193256.1 hypothetical protein [Chloroflexota bacterium]NOH10549.1 hypothetical protein [Chloroflexota bacterium]